MDSRTFALLFGIAANLFCIFALLYNRRVIRTQRRYIEELKGELARREVAEY